MIKDFARNNPPKQPEPLPSAAELARSFHIAQRKGNDLDAWAAANVPKLIALKAAVEAFYETGNLEAREFLYVAAGLVAAAKPNRKKQ